MASTVFMSPQQLLSDIDRALGIEIKAKDKGGNSRSHIAVDGQPRGEQNGFFLYQYSLNEPWSPDDDTPVNIKELGNRSIKPIIVTSTGTMITIAASEPLPPEALKQITLLDDSIELTRRLREALQNIKESDTKLGLKVFGEQSYCSVVASSIPSTIFEPNASQKRAINMALGSEVTYIIGPPGTGKTVTLAAIALAHLISERTVLIASHTNIALDNAIKQLADLCRKAGMNNKLSEGRVLRYGATQLTELKKPEYENISISAIAKRRSAHLSQRKEQLEKSLRIFERDLQKLTADNQKGQDDWDNQRQQVIAHLTAYKSELDRLQAIENQRITALTSEKTVLEDSYRQTMQRHSTIEQQQITAKIEDVRLVTACQQLEKQKDNCTTQLAIAQQMSKITRILKGIRLNTLAKEVSDISYQMWWIEERRKELREQLNQIYAQRAGCESELEQKAHRLRQIESQLHSPTKDAERIAGLQASISQMKQHLVEGDRQWKATHQYFQQRERELVKSRTGISSQLEELTQELQELEKRILAEAQVVATTLSKLYMSAALKDRRFDVVIVDEISAAPMPAVYIAASHANRSVITIGDAQQLGPICTAKNDKRLPENEKELAVSWLGTDLFSYLRISLKTALNGQKACVMLDHQSRMHPHISTIACKYVYDGHLHNEEKRVPQEQLAHIEPVTGQHLVLCDTSDASPVVIKPEGGSRFNVYHALCTIAIARQVLLSLKNDASQEGKQRIGIVTPYRKQAKLLHRLMEDAGMGQWVRVGTVHKFQGLEFDVVIFDTVESSPIAPRPEFIVSGIDAMRLINVAITRARHKLIVVANARHVENAHYREGGLYFPEDAILRKVIVEARNSSIVNSLDILELSPSTPIERQNRYLESVKLQQLLSNSQLDPEDLYEERLNEITFYPRFKQDLQAAKRRIVIVSPYTANRANEIQPILSEKRKEGVSITVVIDPLERFEISPDIEDMLKREGIEVLEYPKAHMKHAIIDEEIIYEGSLNILSHNDRHESMIRKKSQRTAKMVWEELFKAIEKENSEQTESSRKAEQQGIDIRVRKRELPIFSKCLCGRNMVPKLKNGDALPFYGCEIYSKDQQHSPSIKLDENHLRYIAKLRDAKCQCNGPTQVKRSREDVWLECAAAVSCGYWQRITFSQ